MMASALADRLSLDPYRDGDQAALADLLSDRLLLLSLYPQSLNPPAPARVMADWASPSPGAGDRQFAVRLEDRRLIGCVRVERQQLSYFLGRPYWGQGLGRTALGLVTAELRASHAGDLLHALVARDNIASCRVLQRNGFAFSGIVQGPNRLRCVHAYAYRVPARLRPYCQPKNAHSPQ